MGRDGHNEILENAIPSPLPKMPIGTQTEISMEKQMMKFKASALPLNHSMKSISIGRPYTSLFDIHRRTEKGLPIGRKQLQLLLYFKGKAKSLSTS